MHPAVLLAAAPPPADTAGVWTVQLLAVGVAVVGIVLWLVGGKVLKPVLGTIGLIAGALTGLIFLPLLGIGAIGGVPDIVIGAAGGALIGLGLTLAIIRIAVAGLSTALAGTVTLIAAIGYHSLVADPAADAPPDETPTAPTAVADLALSQTPPQPADPAVPPDPVEEEARRAMVGSIREYDRLNLELAASEQVDRLLRIYAALAELLAALEPPRARGATPEQPPAETDPAGPPPGEEPTDAGGQGSAWPLDEIATDSAARSREFLRAVGDAIAAAWNDLSPADRRTTLGATLIAMLVGLAGGILTPRRALAAITAPAGAGLTLAGVVMLLSASDVRLPVLMQPIGWLVLWGVLSIGGLSMQLGRQHRSRRAERK